MPITITPPPPVYAGTTYFKSGAYSSIHGTNNLGTIATLGNGTLRLNPFHVYDTVTFSRIGCEVTSAGDAAATYTICAYSDLGPNTRYPGALLFDSSATGSASTILANGLIGGASATVQEITVNWTFPPGLYWIGGVLQGVTVTQPTFRALGAFGFAIHLGTTIPSAGQVPNSITQSGVTGALPGNFTSTLTSSGTAIPRLFGKVA